jgi:hypothetical protein
MSDLGTFAKRIRKIGQNIERNADEAVRRCALAVDSAVVLATPVDTGRARGNWQVELNTPAVGTTDNVSPSGREAVEAGKAKIAAYKGGTKEASVNITNNLPYIGKLNEGHSAQAPAGFVEKAIAVGVDAVKNFSVIRESK